MSNAPLSAIERIKQASQGLRGTIKESLTDAHTGSIRADDQALVKFHGMYLQDDRDRREIRATKKLERLYSFMIRLRLPGGFLTPEQWICLHHIAGEHSTGVIKITTRQTVQLHGILKSHIRPTLQAFNLSGIDSIATCGDVNRNVIVSGNPVESPLHGKVHAYAGLISEHLKPKSRAWYEIWIGEEKLVEKTEDDPLYQDRYLPRKFKIGIAIPPNNDPDVYANDIGLVAIIEKDKLLGFNVAIGGGMGATHGNEKTYPRVASTIGFVDVADGDEKLLKTVYEIATVQRDFGDRSDRSQARLKYTVDRMGVDGFRAELEKRIGFKLEKARPVIFTHREDRYGWLEDSRGLWNYTAFAENGRVLDDHNCALKTAIYEVAQTGKANIRFTANQGLIVADIKPEDKNAVHGILLKHGVVEWTDKASVLRKNSIACVALPTCPLALSESQRYMPVLITKIETLLEKHGLQNENIITRMTGCPNGCGRSRLCEIGFVGTAPGVYNMYIGGDHVGTRLNQVYRENVQEPEILEALDELFLRFAKEREAGEHFGDFALRKELVKAD
jgi:sulfite reductase (NADPH) hemoprotein beta-component